MIFIAYRLEDSRIKTEKTKKGNLTAISSKTVTVILPFFYVHINYL